MNSALFKVFIAVCAMALAFSVMALAEPLSQPNTNVDKPFPPLSRFPDGMKDAPVPDDSDSSRKAAIERLRQAASWRRPVCPGVDNDVPTLSGTACGTREFEAPPLLEVPELKWFTRRGWSPQQGSPPFILVGNRLIAFEFYLRKGISAFDIDTGNLLWAENQTKDLDEFGQNKNRVDFFARLPDGVLLAGGRPLEFQLDMKTGKLLSKKKNRLNWGSMRMYGSYFVSHGDINKETKHVSARDSDLVKPLWRLEEFVGKCPTPGALVEFCRPYYISQFAFADGILYMSAASKEQSAPVNRQLHAIDIQTGKILWKHTNQPVIYKDKEKRSDDNSPMVVDGKVIIRVEVLLGWPNVRTNDMSSASFRALDARTGAELWTIDPIPASFKDEWLPRGRDVERNQRVEEHLIAGNMLVVAISGRFHREIWAYRLSDGRPAWRRPLEWHQYGPLGLAASAGGVLYLMDGEIIMALDAETGTRLWTYSQPIDMDNRKSLNMTRVFFGMEGGEMTNNADQGEIFWPADFVIGPDGAFYGVANGPFKIR